MKIGELMSDICKHNLVLPEFQREFVWNKDRAKQLMVSLVKEYPVGGLLFWKTDRPPELKNIDHKPEKVGTIQVILDGQQRLTTLHMLLTGDVPAYYTQRDIMNDPRDLYYNLDSGDFQYYQRTLMEGNPLWQRVVDCFTDRTINVFEIAQRQVGSTVSAFELAQRYNHNLNQLRQVREKDLPVQTVPPSAQLEEAINIFDRVNSLGTKLTDAELALTHVTGKWARARRVIKEKLSELASRNFDFDLTFMTRALVGVVCNRALFETIHGRPLEQLEEGWARLEKILDYLVAILPQHAYVHSTEDLNTTNVLIPLIVYLARNEGRFGGSSDLKRAVHWLYAAHTWSRYTAQTDQRLEHDVSLVVRESSPWKALCDQIIDQRGRLEVKPNDLEGRWSQHPLYRMSYMLAKSGGAVDWFNGVPLGASYGKAYRLHSHHIFPQELLYRNGYDRDNHLDRKRINEIANRAFLTAETNIALKDESPDVYLPDVEAKYPGALSKQFVPMNPALWKVTAFPDFLEARRALIATKLNELMDSLISEPEIVHERRIQELIPLGESATLEFKSTLQWDVTKGNVNKELRSSVLKTVAAFLNSDGGTLVIGVEDTGAVIGLENDLKQMGGSRDVFLQILASLVVEHIGAEFGPFVRARIEDIDSQVVCVVDVDKSQQPAFVQGKDAKQFYVRVGNTTRPLDSEEAVRYIQMNWE